MTIRAQSADGQLHEFPDGTDGAVIDRVMKEYAQSKMLGSGTGQVESFADRNGIPFLSSPEAQRRYADEQVQNAPGRLASVYQGATLGFGDEIAGLAGGTVSALADPFGRGGFERGYDATRDAVRNTANDYAERNPESAIALNLVGGGASVGVMPRAFFASAASTPLRIAGAGATGSVVGGIAGFGAGEGGLENRLASAGEGAVVGGLLGSGAETVLSGFARLWRARGGPAMTDAQGNPTAAALALAREAGIDPSQLSPELLARMNAVAARGGGAGIPGSANAVAAESLPVPVPLTRGQATNDIGQLARENALARGADGADGMSVMADFRNQQQDALYANIPAYRERIAGGAPIVERGQGGEIISGRANELHDAAQAQSRGLYARAEELTPPTPLADRPFGTDKRGAIDPLTGSRRDANTPGRRADLPQGESQRMMQNAWDAMVAEIPVPENAGPVASLLTRFGASADGAGLPIADIFQMRKMLTNLQGGPPSPTTIAARAAKRAIDRGLDDAVRNDLLAGDAEAVNAWRTAINNYRDDYAARFKNDDLVSALVARDRSNGGRLRVAPEEATNYIFGSTDLGFIDKRNMARNLTRLRDVLGADSDAWSAIRQEAFNRIANKAIGRSGPNGREFSGANFAKAWEEFNSKNPELARTIFSAEERRDIGNFANVARRATTLDSAVYAPSTSPFQMRRIMDMAAKRIPYIGNWIAEGMRGAVGANAARAATSGQLAGLPRQGGRGVPTSIGAGIAGYQSLRQ